MWYLCSRWGKWSPRKHWYLPEKGYIREWTIVRFRLSWIPQSFKCSFFFDRIFYFLHFLESTLLTMDINCPWLQIMCTAWALPLPHPQCCNPNLNWLKTHLFPGKPFMNAGLLHTFICLFLYVLWEYVWRRMYPYVTARDRSDVLLNYSSPWCFKLRPH